MRRRFLALALLSFFVLPASAQSPLQDFKNFLPEAEARCVEMISVTAHRVQVGKGSGVNIGRGLILIPFHGLIAETQLFANGVPIRVLKVDNFHDLALVSADVEKLPPIKMAETDAKKLDEVMYVGNPDGLLCAPVPGAVVDANAREMIVTTLPQPGFSGSGYYNRKGELVALGTSMQGTNPPSSWFSRAVPISVIRKFLEDVDLEKGVLKRECPSQ